MPIDSDSKTYLVLKTLIRADTEMSLVRLEKRTGLNSKELKPRLEYLWSRGYIRRIRKGDSSKTLYRAMD